MCALAEGSAHADSQAYAGLSKLVPQAIGSGQGVLPALLAISIEQVDLIGLLCERRGMYAQQSHLHAFLPVLAKECADLLEDFGVELRGAR